MKPWELSGAWVVGGTRALDAEVPFAHARPVLCKPQVQKRGSEEFLLVYRYPSAEEAEGELMTLSEWEGLIDAGQAHRLSPPLGASYNGTLWLLGGGFPNKDQVVEELSDAGALIDVYKDPMGEVRVCYVNSALAGEVRERAAENALARAWRKTWENAWDEAVPHADLALAIGGLSPERVALLALLYERQGKKARSKGYLRMMLNSRGSDAYEETIEKFGRFSAEVEDRRVVAVTPILPHRVAKSFANAVQLTKAASRAEGGRRSAHLWRRALPLAREAREYGGDSPERVALVSYLQERLGEKQSSAYDLKTARVRHGEEFYKETRKKIRDFSTLNESVAKAPQPTSRDVFWIIALTLPFVIFAVWILVQWTVPAYSSIRDLRIDNGNEGVEFLRKLSATILVYFMQFGFIGFEAGYVRQSYRRASAIKNLIVFAISFSSYMFLGWVIQRRLSGHPSTLLDICFNAGFASTVALIIANTITERGTVFINSLFSIVAAGLAYPILAGLIFDNGPFARSLGFVDTAGGCVVHVLGGAFGCVAAIWIGPRVKRRAWSSLGRVQIAEQRDILPFSVIGAFFLWFGWLGFNSGNATTWNHFIVAFFNTNIGASAGGLVGLLIAVANMARLTRTASSDLTSRGKWRDMLRDTASLERVIIGMMGGLVAVTANASYVKPWQALIEAIVGAAFAIVGSSFLTHYFWERLDDPLGAIATHGFAGTVGVIGTAVFYHPQNSWYRQLGVQALGWGMAIFIGGALALVFCAILWKLEHRRKGGALWLYGKLFRLTAYEQLNDSTGTEFWSRDEAIERSKVIVRTTPPILQEEVDEEWISAVAVLALSDEPDEKLGDLFSALDSLLESSSQGRPEEQAAIAAFRARVRVHKLLMCVDRALAHRNRKLSKEVREWKDLDSHYPDYPSYRESLIVTITDLAEGFAAGYRIRVVTESPTDLDEMIVGFGKACELLDQIGRERTLGKKLRRLAARNFLYLKRLPWYDRIIEKYEQIRAASPEDRVAASGVAAARPDETESMAR